VRTQERIDVIWKELATCWTVLGPIRMVAHSPVACIIMCLDVSLNWIIESRTL